MFKILDEQEGYLLLTDGAHFTVAERRGEKFYGLRNSACRAVAADDAGVAELISRTRSLTEAQAHHLLDEVATQWRGMFEHIR